VGESPNRQSLKQAINAAMRHLTVAE